MAFTWTPRMPKMMKKAQQMRTMLPMGLRDVMRVSTTSFSPGALLITLEDQEKERYRGAKREGERDQYMMDSQTSESKN